jgi:XRE family aerobic/anaerobic benzoate catabolism transcriptional regulator
LAAIGERVRLLRARRGLTRKQLSVESDVSERHLANLENGSGNASVLVLRQIANALGSTVAELVGDETAASAEWLLIRELLHGRGDVDLARAREVLTNLFEDRRRDPERMGRIAFVGLRGAGKSTLGRMIASELSCPFIELSAEIEKLAGCPRSEIHDLYGANAYRRYELRALENVVASHPRMVLATPGGIVSESETLNLLLAKCFTVWLRATPEDHMKRVAAQGDLRPMAASAEAMTDLKSILAGRTDFYAKSDLAFDTSGQSLGDAFLKLRDRLQSAYAGRFQHAQ